MIAAYGWDWNNDGKIDEFGRQVSHYFNSPGISPVTLTVWDTYGKTGRITQNVNVTYTAYSNLIVNGDFSLGIAGEIVNLNDVIDCDEAMRNFSL